jgi:hypothetical protein
MLYSQSFIQKNYTRKRQKSMPCMEEAQFCRKIAGQHLEDAELGRNAKLRRTLRGCKQSKILGETKECHSRPAEIHTIACLQQDAVNTLLPGFPRGGNDNALTLCLFSILFTPS